MTVFRVGAIYLLIASLLAAPLAGAQEPCASETPAGVAQFVHADHGMSHHQPSGDHSASTHVQMSAGDDGAADRCSCCEQCAAICAVAGFASLAVSSLTREIDAPVGTDTLRISITPYLDPPLLCPFRPPIQLA